MNPPKNNKKQSGDTGAQNPPKPTEYPKSQGGAEIWALAHFALTKGMKSRIFILDIAVKECKEKIAMQYRAFQFLNSQNDTFLKGVTSSQTIKCFFLTPSKCR